MERGSNTTLRFMPEAFYVYEYDFPLLQPNVVGGQIEQSRPGKGRPFSALILFLACLLAGSFASQSRFYTLLFAGLQVGGVALDLLDNVFLLHLAFKPA
jgi:hypothetical protein